MGLLQKPTSKRHNMLKQVCTRIFRTMAREGRSYGQVVSARWSQTLSHQSVEQSSSIYKALYTNTGTKYEQTDRQTDRYTPKFGTKQNATVHMFGCFEIWNSVSEAMSRRQNMNSGIQRC